MLNYLLSFGQIEWGPTFSVRNLMSFMKRWSSSANFHKLSQYSTKYFWSPVKNLNEKFKMSEKSKCDCANKSSTQRSIDSRPFVEEMQAHHFNIFAYVNAPHFLRYLFSPFLSLGYVNMRIFPIVLRILAYHWV